MVWDVSFTCDICGRKKSESNHWWMLVLGDVPCFEARAAAVAPLLSCHGTKAESGHVGFHHLCGQGCATQAMERFMNQASVDNLLHGAPVIKSVV